MPALLSEGLLHHTREHYELPPGYYPLETLFLLLALLALVSCPSMEQVRYESPGEWGQLKGLDRLPEAERFAQLCPESKHFIDTIKMIAYRAESSMAGELKDHIARGDDVRALLRRLYTTQVNLRPDVQAQTLTVELHRMDSSLQDAAIAELCKTLTDTETTFPTTSLRLIYRQVGSA